MRKPIQRIISAMLSLCLLLSYVPIQIFAVSYDEEYDISAGNVTISEAGNYLITGTSSSYTVTISGNDDINVTLSGVSITSSSTAPIKITNTGTTTITLEGESTLKSTCAYAALQTANVAGSELVITGDGTLNAENTSSGAGIGTQGAQSAHYGTITIESGTIVAKNGTNGAAIGTGVATSTSGNPNYLTINIEGGDITASATSGAAIGGGACVDNYIINITGGTVTATSTTQSSGSGNHGAAIGGGNNGGGTGTINISGEDTKVTATAIGNAEAIGRGATSATDSTKLGTVSITEGATVTASSTGAACAINGMTLPDDGIEASWEGTVNGTYYTTKATYTVSFDSQGGTDVSSISVLDGNTITQPDDPTREGHIFDGWYTDEDCSDGNKYDFETEVTASFTLYAKWLVGYTVTFNYGYDDKIETQGIVSGETATVPTAPTRDGYTFGGWFEDGLESSFDFTTAITADTTLVAQWTVNTYTLSFNESSETITATYDSAIGTLPTVTTSSEDTEFAGWYIGNDLITANTIWTYTESKTAVAKWKAPSSAIVTSQSELEAALSDSSIDTIVVGASFTITSDITISQDVTIYSNGDYTIDTSNDSNFIIDDGTKVVLGYEDCTDILTITLGDATYNDPAIKVGTASNSTATLTMYDGISISDNTGVNVYGTFTMNGGEITKNSANTFGGVFVQPTGTFIMNGGLISGNYSGANGGGVAANGNNTGTTTVTLNGGTITGNTANTDGYAVRITGSFIALTISADMVITLDEENSNNQFSWGGTEKSVNVSAKVTYNANGGTGSVTDSITYSYSVTKGTYTATVLDGASLTKTGSTFSHWNTQADGSGTSYDADDSLTQSVSITLYAIWKVADYSVTFDSMYGSDVDAQGVSYGGTITEPETPTKEGFVFGGWYTDSGFTTKYDFENEVTSSFTLYAEWFVGYTVTFMNGSSTFATQGVVKDDTVPEPSNTAITGYTFGGWYNESTFATTFDFSTEIHEDTTVYGQWTAITIGGGSSESASALTFDANGGTISGETNITVTYDQKIGTLPTATWENYDFVGWYIDEDLITADTIWKYTEAQTAVASWTKSASQIVYNQTELEAAIDDSTVTTIVVGASFEISSEVTFDRPVTLISNGDYTLSVGDSSTSCRFVIKAEVDFGQEYPTYPDATLTLSLGGTMVAVAINSGGTLNMYDGIKISGGKGVATVATNTTFNMYGGEISNNTYTNGGAVNLNASGSVFNMYGGTISGNTATSIGGGALYIGQSGATANLYGGTIYNNSAKLGTAIYSIGTLNVTDTVIYDDDPSDDDNLIYTTGTTSITISLTYMTNDGDAIETFTDTITDGNGYTVTLPTEDELTAPDGKPYFMGWNTSADGTGTSYAGGDTYTIYSGETILYAMWSDGIFILKLDAANGTTTEHTVNYGVAIGSPIYTPVKDGYIFIRWEIDGEKITSDTIWTYQTDKTATAIWENATDTVFATVSSKGVVGTGDDAYTASQLTEAFSSGKSLVLQRDFTLPAGDYVISNGTKIVIPRTDGDDGPDTYAEVYDENEKPSTGYDQGKYKPDYEENDTYDDSVGQFAYCTLTLDSGAILTVGDGTATSWYGDEYFSGVLIVNAKMNYDSHAHTGFAYGGLGKIILRDNAEIVVESNGNLEVYGYIQTEEEEWGNSFDHTGKVTAKPGALVGELLEFADYKGGSISVEISDSVVPINQYYVQNIQTTFIIESGAALISHYFLKLTIDFGSIGSIDLGEWTGFRQNYCYYIVGAEEDGIPANLDGTTGDLAKIASVFWLESGYIERNYTPPSNIYSQSSDNWVVYTERHRITLDLYGTLVSGGISEKIYYPKYGTYGSQQLVDFTSGFVRPYPVNGDLNVNIYSGSEFIIDNVLKIIPGMQIYVAENAAVTVKETDHPEGFANKDDAGIGGLYLYTINDFIGTWPYVNNYMLSYQYGDYAQSIPTETSIVVDGTMEIDGGGIYVSANGKLSDENTVTGEGNGIEVFLKGYTDNKTGVSYEPTISFGDDARLLYTDYVNWVSYSDTAQAFFDGALSGSLIGALDEDGNDADYPDFLERDRLAFYRNDVDDKYNDPYTDTENLDYITMAAFGFPLYTVTYYPNEGTVVGNTDATYYQDIGFWGQYREVLDNSADSQFVPYSTEMLDDTFSNYYEATFNEEAPEISFDTNNFYYEKEGYKFIGWNTDDTPEPYNFGTLYEIGDPLILTEDLVLYAWWATTGWTLTYNLNGGQYEDDFPTVEDLYQYQEVEISSKIPTKDGYTFLFWTDEDGNSYTPSDSYNVATTLIMPDHDVVLTAQWSDNTDLPDPPVTVPDDDGYIVTYIENGGSPVTDETGLDGDETITFPETTRTGYFFAGWYGFTYTEILDENGDVVTPNEDGSITVNGKTYTEDDYLIAVDEEYNVHYYEGHWLTADDGNYVVYEAGDTYEMSDENLVFYALWSQDADGVGDLTITVSGTIAIDENQSYVFYVTNEDGSISLTVVVHGNTSVTIRDLPVGRYTVTPADDWSWRYGLTTANNTITVTSDGNNTIPFTSTRKSMETNYWKWLNGCAWCENKWDEDEEGYILTAEHDNDEVDNET